MDEWVDKLPSLFLLLLVGWFWLVLVGFGFWYFETGSYYAADLELTMYIRMASNLQQLCHCLLPPSTTLPRPLSPIFNVCGSGGGVCVSVYVDVHTCVWARMRVHVHMGTHACRGQRLTSGIILSHFSTLCTKVRLLSQTASRASQLALGTCL